MGKNTSNQFLPLCRFSERKKDVTTRNRELLRDLGITVLLLTTQLKQKFDVLEHEVEENSKKNDTKRTLQQETESLRRDLDRTISLLSTQLKQKFDYLEHKVEENSKKNDTDLDCIRMDRYLAVEQKLNQLQNENNGLKRDYNLVKMNCGCYKMQHPNTNENLRISNR
ncbi:unnamed protein product [Mytilus edulis]|uniref:Uncharacterized protein n=1 Tax=Mytilus edulis TaxID=6550 RepID=A0A8S3Q7V1_MYTED|nr:unnamed protein product [Mytilus edulis]